MENCKIALGGSGLKGEDLDLIFIAPNLKFEKIRFLVADLKTQTGKKITVSPMSELQAKHTELWSSKVACMVYKGLTWLYGKYNLKITWDKLLEIRKRDRLYEVNYWQKVLCSEPKESKAVEILIQELLFLNSYNEKM